MNIKTWMILFLSVFVITTKVMTPAKVFASESGSTDSVTLPTCNEEIVSVILPTEALESPIDFYIDPQGLIFETDAAKYGGGTVEEGANILFHNHKSDEYDFSSKSDPFKITNQSTVPVNVTITARIDNLESITLADSRDFPEDQAAIYLALLDDDGNEVPLSADEDVSLTVNMKAASMGAYAYVYDEDAGQYRYGYLVNSEEDYFDTYAFGLVGDCNESDVWAEISESPKVTVTWKVEPVMGGDESDPEEDEQNQEVPEDVTKEDVQDETTSENEAFGEPIGSEADEQGEESGNQTQQDEGRAAENIGAESMERDNGGERNGDLAGEETHIESGEIVSDGKGTKDSTGNEGEYEAGDSLLNGDSDNENLAID